MGSAETGVASGAGCLCYGYMLKKMNHPPCGGLAVGSSAEAFRPDPWGAADGLAGDSLPDRCGQADLVSAAHALVFTPDGPDGVRSRFATLSRFQGYEGILHGGMISTLLDAAMGECLFSKRIAAVTAEMTVRFLRPVPLDRVVDLRAELVSARHGLFLLSAGLSLDDRPLARATGKFRRRA